ncbi:MAG: sensor histidine kinase [Candidatus Izimaplasma sp.]|nr:sensor histidine kinase [Candidatus Izimaplasma bacterium]
MNKKISLRGRILFSLVGILLISTFLMLFVIREISKNKIENESQENIVERHEQFDSAFLNIINRVTYTNLYLFDNSQDLYDELSSNSSYDSKQTFVENLVQEASLDEDTFGKIGVYYQQDMFTTTLNNELISDPGMVELEKTLNEPEGLYYIETVNGYDGQNFLVFAQHISTMYPNRQIFGLALFYLHESLINDSLLLLTSELNLDEAYSFVYTETNNHKIIYSLQEGTYFPSEIYQNLNEKYFLITEIDNEKIIIIKTDLSEINTTYNNLDFAVISVLSYDILFADFLQLNQYILAVGLVSFVFLLFLASRTSERILKPVRKLIENLRLFKKYRKKENLSILNEKDEIYELEQTYNQMIEEIIRLIDENNTEMENKRKLELYALQMQINPHFLYNTLDTIAWLAKLKNEKDIEHLVLSLAKFFRLSLHKGDKFIKIKEEIDLVKSFLEIEKMRFPELFEVEYDINENILEVETLKLILQPIVENAIKHGFSNIDYKGKIFIRAYSKLEEIIFEVEDNGLGFDPDEEIFAENKLYNGLGGYGLKNVDERIKLEYGRENGVNIISEVNKGTKVVIKIKKTQNKSLST